jgi:hypothetical protein
MKKLLAVLLLTLPTMAVAVDLDGYYFTAKGGVSKTMDTGTTALNNLGGQLRTFENEDLGTGSAFGFSVGKYLTNNFRLELEAIKRTGYEYDANASTPFTAFTEESKIQTDRCGAYRWDSFWRNC